MSTTPTIGKGEPAEPEEPRAGPQLSTANENQILGMIGKYTDDDGRNYSLTGESVQSLIRNIENKNKAQIFYRRSTVVSLLVILALAGVTFLMSWLAAEATKEVRVSSAGALVTPDGVEVATSQMLTERPLSSSMADVFFQALDEVIVHSDTGHVLHVKIHGFARMPVRHSRCGNVVHLYTAWNGHIVLDDYELSFDGALETQFKEVGFSVVVHSGTTRRLSGSNTLAGLFHHVAEGPTSNWACTDVELPKYLPFLSHTEVRYVPCNNDPSQADFATRCDSIYGGTLPTVSTVPEKHVLSSVGKATITKTLTGLASTDIREALFLHKETDVFKSEHWEVQKETWQSHPGQELIYVFNKKARKAVTFQNHKGARYYCKVVPDAELPSELEAQASMALQYNYNGLVWEDGVAYRYFQMILNATVEGMPSVLIYHFWDSAESLAPYRLVLPNGNIIVFKDVLSQTSDAALERVLEDMGLTAEEATACSNVASGALPPEMKSAWDDLSTDEIGFYAGSAASAEFTSYKRKAVGAMATPTVCQKACLVQLQAYKANKAAKTDCAKIKGLSQCLLGAKERTCANSPLAKTLRQALRLSSCTSRRLQVVSHGPAKLSPKVRSPNLARGNGSTAPLRQLGFSGNDIRNAVANAGCNMDKLPNEDSWWHTNGYKRPDVWPESWGWDEEFPPKETCVIFACHCNDETVAKCEHACEWAEGGGYIVARTNLALFWEAAEDILMYFAGNAKDQNGDAMDPPKIPLDKDSSFVITAGGKVDLDVGLPVWWFAASSLWVGNWVWDNVVVQHISDDSVWWQVMLKNPAEWVRSVGEAIDSWDVWIATKEVLEPILNNVAKVKGTIKGKGEITGQVYEDPNMGCHTFPDDSDFLPGRTIAGTGELDLKVDVQFSIPALGDIIFNENWGDWTSELRKHVNDWLTTDYLGLDMKVLPTCEAGKLLSGSSSASINMGFTVPSWECSGGFQWRCNRHCWWGGCGDVCWWEWVGDLNCRTVDIHIAGVNLRVKLEAKWQIADRSFAIRVNIDYQLIFFNNPWAWDKLVEFDIFHQDAVSLTGSWCLLWGCGLEWDVPIWLPYFWVDW